jgi:hypothetical protein
LNKKVNTVVFVVVASIFNIILALVILILLMIPIAYLGKISTALQQILTIIIFPTSFFIAFIIYFNLIAFIDSKIDLDKYIHPIFINKKKK